jgi:hypothetical protein
VDDLHGAPYELENRVAAVAISQDNRWVVAADHYDGTVQFLPLGR